MNRTDLYPDWPKHMMLKRNHETHVTYAVSKNIFSQNKYFSNTSYMIYASLLTQNTDEASLKNMWLLEHVDQLKS